MTYLTDMSSTPEFKAYEGTKKQLGGFDKMWNMLKKEAEKKPQDLSITIIDTEYMTRYSLKRAATEKYLDDQLLNTFSSYTNRESRNGRTESLLSIHCYTTHFLTKLFQEDEKFDYTKVAQWCRKRRREDQNMFLKDTLFFPVNFVNTHWSLLVVYPLEKRMAFLDSINSHPHAGFYYAIIQYLQREYEQYYSGNFRQTLAGNFAKRR
jgi:Ulp1 family protease